MNGNVIRTITIRGTSEGLDKVTGDLNKLAAAQENVAVVSEQSARRVLSLEDAWKRQTLKLDEAARAQANIARETKIADAALREGVATQAQHAQRLEQINQRYTTVTTATKGFAEQTGLARHELINLGRQAQDVGVSLVSGQSPLMVLAQQGSQIADVFISSGKSVGSFFSQAIAWAGRFFTSTAGIVTGIAAIGVAAVYAASQFVRASTTVEQALENQNRLLKEGKALIDARTSAEARAQLQSKEQTQFETMRNLLDLQNKLNKAMEDAAKLAASRATTPTGGGMPEMGIAPSGFAPLKDPGLDKMTDAFVKLNAAREAGLPGLKEFNAELSKIGLAHPELAKIVEDMINAGRAGMDLEFATMRARAMSDALKGVAKDAQLAAVGLGSIAQHQLNVRLANERAEATERMAVATLKMAERYPGISIEVAKTLEGLKGQLAVAGAVGKGAEIEAQRRATINQLLLEGKTHTEAIRVANMQAAIALAKIESAHQVTMVTLRGQLAVAQQITGLEQINAQRQANINNLLLQGLNLTQATAQADMQRAIALAQVNTAAQQRLSDLEDEGRVIRANSAEEKEKIKSANTYNKLLREGVDRQLAANVAGQQESNEREQRENQEAEASARATEAADQRAIAYRNAADAAEHEAFAMQQAAEAAVDAARAVMAFVPFGTGSSGSLTYTMGQNLFQSKQGGYSQFRPEGYTSSYMLPEYYYALASYGEGGFDMQTGKPNAQGYEFQYNQMLAGGQSSGAGVSGFLSSTGSLWQGGGLGGQGAIDTAKLGVATRAIDLLPKDQQAGAIKQILAQLESAPSSLATAETIQSLTQKLEQLTQATEENTSATQSMTDVLSPYYSSDPRRTHLGFRAFRDGGIMSQYGELPIRQYQGGGVATTPQVAVYGEGSTPEAYVPVPSGRIPVEIKQPANSNRPVNVTINVQGNADASTVAALKATAFQQAQAMRRVIG